MCIHPLECGQDLVAHFCGLTFGKVIQHQSRDRLQKDPGCVLSTARCPLWPLRWRLAVLCWAALHRGQRDKWLREASGSEERRPLVQQSTRSWTPPRTTWESWEVDPPQAVRGDEATASGYTLTAILWETLMERIQIKYAWSVTKNYDIINSVVSSQWIVR